MKKYQGETVHPLSVMQYCPKCGHAGFVVNDERSKKCEKCGFTFYLNCATAVAGVIMKGESLLLTRRAEEPYKGMWDLPGGFVEFDETPEEALVREVKEELSLKIRVKHYLFRSRTCMLSLRWMSGLPICFFDVRWKVRNRSCHRTTCRRLALFR